MSITRDFKLSLVAGRSVPLVINANQYDDGEVWRFTLLDENGQKYSPSTGSIIGLKSDGHIIANAGTVSSTGLVIIAETEQMTASPGKNFYELLIDDDTHGTANFTVFVEPRPGADGTPSDSDLAVFQEAIDAAAQIGDASELVDDVAVLKSRMDEFTTLTDGSTTGDAELADIRVGADGTTYPNAGDAVRGQVSDLKNAIDYYLNGVDASYPIIGGASNRIEFPFLKDAIYTITNNTDNNCWNLRVYKKDGTNTVIDSTFASNESVTYIPTTDDIIAFSGFFDGTGTVSVKCNYKGLQVDITPEMFGAKGDGVTNDYTALTSAINYCITNNIPLYGNGRAVYAVGNTLSITNPPDHFHINLNGATIKALSGYSLNSSKPVLKFTKTNAVETNGYAKINRFENFNIDTNDVSSGIQLDYGYDFVFQNINILACKGFGIRVVSGGECYFNNIAIKSVHNSGNSTGLQVESSDYHFTDVVIIDADRAIYNASSSMYTRVHAWNTANCSGTYYFVHASGYPVLNQCHADTYETAYYRETDRPLMLIGCVYYINSNLYDSSATPVVFKFTDSSISYSGNIKCVNCMFDALRTEVNMTESVHKIQLINCSKKGTINRYYNGTSLGLSNGTADTGLAVNANTIAQEGDYLHYYFILNVTDVDLTGANAKTIGSISNTRFRPRTFMVYPCMFFTDDYATNMISGYITINNNNGVVQVKPNVAGTYKKIIADFKEYRPLGLYES